MKKVMANSVCGFTMGKIYEVSRKTAIDKKTSDHFFGFVLKIGVPAR